MLDALTVGALARAMFLIVVRRVLRHFLFAHHIFSKPKLLVQDKSLIEVTELTGLRLLGYQLYIGF
jgi:hypothetical protein